jgi:hypothetical protein
VREVKRPLSYGRTSRAVFGVFWSKYGFGMKAMFEFMKNGKNDLQISAEMINYVL